MSDRKMIEITEKNLKELKAEYESAREAGQTSFMFDGVELVTNYAQYLIEYAEYRLKQTKGGV